jgi:hypothetical protein
MTDEQKQEIIRLARANADGPRIPIGETDRIERRALEREARRERIDRENERVHDWIQRKNFEDASEPVAETDGGGWNAWFDRRFMELTRPVLEATGKHIAGLLDEERRQSREELALEVQRLNTESARLFAVITELQQTLNPEARQACGHPASTHLRARPRARDRAGRTDRPLPG